MIPIKAPEVDSEFWPGFAGCAEPLAAGSTGTGSTVTKSPWGLRFRSPALAANNLLDYITAPRSISAERIDGVSEQPYVPRPTLLFHHSPVAWCCCPAAVRQGSTQGPEKK